MKMTGLHFRALESAIDEVLKESDKTLEEFQASYRLANLSDKRLRWDILWAVAPTVRKNLFSDFYHYLDDTHIDTALRTIIKARTLRQ